MQTRRRTLKALAAAGLLGPAGISGLIRDALAKGDAPIRPGLHKIRGEVVVNRRLATEGQLIKPGDTIVTGAGSEAIYVIGNDAFMQRELTTVSFGAEAVQNLMRVVSGKILSVFGKGARTIQVSTATIGIRGTDLAINIAGVNYTVTVQNGAITLNAVPISTGQGATGQTSAPVVPVPVITLPAAAIAAVAATVQKAVPPTNPVGVSQQSTLVQAVAKATALAATAQAPGATDAQKAEAATAARQVQEAVVATLQATQQAIQAAVQAGATSATATGAPAKSGTTPGATPPVGKSETQQAVDTVKAINNILPADQKLNATQINQLDQQAQQQAQQQGSAQQGTGQQGTGQQGPLPTAEQQQILNVLQEFKPPTPPPVTCGGAGQSPCQ